MKRNKTNDRPRRRMSVKWRLILLLILLDVVTLALIWFGQTFFMDKIYMKIRRNELMNGCSAFAACTTDEERREVSRSLADSGICTAVYRLEGGDHLTEICTGQAHANCNCLLHRRLTMTSAGPQDGMNPGFDGRIRAAEIMVTIRRAKDVGGNSFVNPPRGKGEDSSEELTRVILDTSEENVTVAYFLNTAIVPLSSTVKTLNSILLYVSVALVVTSVLFALAIALWITNPISEINKSAKRLAACDYSVKFDAKGYKEIEELSDTLNYASSELAKVDALQKELIANISHDLRTPLTLISGYAEVMRDLPDENTEENLQIIIDESNRMKALVNDVLDISKIRSGTAPFVMTAVQLTNCIESELTRYNKLRDREGYSIEFRYNELATVKGDASRLMQVVYNLVNNAVTYTGEDKKVLVTQTVKDGKVRISVIDTGKGIAPEELPLIWDRYYKVDKTHKRAQIGTGLGLSIVKGVVEAHGGTCGVNSAPGKGSDFWFELDVLSVSPLENAD